MLTRIIRSWRGVCLRAAWAFTHLTYCVWERSPCRLDQQIWCCVCVREREHEREYDCVNFCCYLLKSFIYGLLVKSDICFLVWASVHNVQYMNIFESKFFPHRVCNVSSLFLFKNKNAELLAQDDPPVFLFFGSFFLVYSEHFVSCLTRHFKYTARGMIASQRKAPRPYPYFGFAICMHLHDFIMHRPFVPWVGTTAKKKKMEIVQIQPTRWKKWCLDNRKVLSC